MNEIDDKFKNYDPAKIWHENFESLIMKDKNTAFICTVKESEIAGRYPIVYFRQKSDYKYYFDTYNFRPCNIKEWENVGSYSYFGIFGETNKTEVVFNHCLSMNHKYKVPSLCDERTYKDLENKFNVKELIYRFG